MPKPPRMTTVPYLSRPIPVSEAEFLKTIVDSAILKAPGGVSKRKVDTVKKKTSEASLIANLKYRKLSLIRFGTHYIIYNPYLITGEKLI